MPTAKQLFEAREITCARGGRVLFRNVSLQVEDGEILHLSGGNGAGKSSLLRVLAGALPVLAGKIFWNGADFLQDGPAAHAERFAFLPPEDTSLKPLETALENMEFWAKVWGTHTDGIVESLSKTGLSGLRHEPVRRFSAGQKRRLSLARLLMKESPLWLLDEPFNGLDAQAAGLFMTALGEHARRGGLAVVASHLPFSPPDGAAVRRLELAGRAAA